MNELIKKIEKNIEVEDLIELAVKNKTSSVPILKRAIEEKQWEDYKKVEESRKVPLKTWAEVVISYLENGYDGLEYFTISKDGSYLETARFVISLLDDIKSIDTIKSLLYLFYRIISDPSINKDLSKRLVSAINKLLSFKPYLTIEDDDRDLLRNFVLKYLSLYGDIESNRSTAFCALRGVGDLESIDIVKSYPEMEGSNKGVEKIVIKEIKKRNKM